MPTDGTTFINPLGLAFLLLMGALMLVLPRRYALLPVVILTCYMTMGERVMIAGLNFTMIRILLLFGWFRLVARGEIRALKLNSIDKVILLWVLSSIVMHTLLWQSSQEFINRLGGAYSALGTYFLFRYLVLDMDDIVRVFRILAVCLGPLAVFMIIEGMSGHNVLAVFGGVPESPFVRDDVVRCQGPFAHPILAGTFGATSLPLCMALWWHERRASRIIPAIGILSCLIIILTSGSSGPMLAGLAGLFALLMWSFRRHLSIVRWGTVLGLILLQLVMKAPVWFIIARVDILSGSTGYHRAYLIDRAIANFGDWWLVGTKSTAAWAAEDDHLFDVTNAYISEGANGGLITMILFIAIIVLCFRAVGRAIQALPGERRTQLAWWAVGSALFAHAVTFFSVSYFDQNFVVWFLLLAIISTSTSFVPLPASAARNLAPPVEFQPARSAGLSSDF